MRFYGHRSLLLAGLLLAVTPAATPAEVRFNDGSLTLDVENALLAAVLRAVAEAANVRLSLHGSIDQAITRRLNGVPLQTGLKRLVGAHPMILLYGPVALSEIRVYGSHKAHTAFPAAEREPLDRIYGAVAGAERTTRQQFVRDLVSARGGAAAEDLVTILTHEKDRMVRRTAVDGLGMIGQAALPALSDALMDKRPVVRMQVTRALAMVGNKDAARVLEAGLHDRHAMVRIKAIQALGRMGGADMPFLLADVLRDEQDPVVRRAAVSTLGTLDRDSARWALKLATRDRDPAVRQVAYELLLGKAATAMVEDK